MLKSLPVSITPILDGLLPGEVDWNDWTPMENRILARQLDVSQRNWSVSLSEMDKDDPTMVRLFINHRGGALGDDEDISVQVSAKDIDELIQALTVARDAAIANWMIEPAQ